MIDEGVWEIPYYDQHALVQKQANDRCFLEKYYGRLITSANIDEQRLLLELDGKLTIRIFDGRQICYENRYITCDDNVKDLIGQRLTKIEDKKGGDSYTDYTNHEWVFVEVSTDKDHITFCTHVEHNGYYGGFELSVKEVKDVKNTS